MKLTKLLLIFLFSLSLYGKNIYILKSNSTINSFKKLNIDTKFYLDSISNFKNFLSTMGYKARVIQEYDILNLKPNSILILLDTLSLSLSYANDIKKFVKSGGSLLFNYNSGFNNGVNFINFITKFSQYSDITHIDMNKKRAFLTPKILSPLTKYIKGKRLDFLQYEKMPIFKIPINFEPDVLITNKAQNIIPRVIKKRNYKKIDIKVAGVMWHSEIGEGKWVYFNFPAYAIFNSKNRDNYQKLFKGVMEYLDNEIVVRKFPFLDSKNAILLYESVFYNYNLLNDLLRVVKKLKFPITTFQVANLALQNPDTLQKIVNSKYIEIASLGYTHRKIVGVNNEFIKRETIGSKNLLDSLINSKKRVYGFSPPHDNLDSKIVKYLIDGVYSYLLSPNLATIYPTYDYSPLIAIPKTATDDMKYMLKLEWNDRDILTQMKNEAKLLTYLNGVYSFNFHSHIMGHYLNLDLIEEFVEFVKKYKSLKLMQIKEATRRVKRVFNIKLTKIKKAKGFYDIIIDNKNSRVVENFSFRLYLKANSKIKLLFSNSLKLSYTKRKWLNEYDIVVKKLNPRKKYTISLEF